MVGFAVLIAVYVLASVLLLGYGLQCYLLTALYLKNRAPKLAYHQERMKFFDGKTDEEAYPYVVTQLPMFNEKTVAIRIIEAAAAMTYPRSRHEIQVLDDSTDETVEIVRETVARLKAEGINIVHIHRSDRTGFKAGALQHGLEHTKAEFAAIFDADFVPNPDFLLKAVPFFVDKPEIGLVQGRWTHLNRQASLITRSQAMGIDGHFMIEQAARSWSGLFMNFNGTAGIFRVKAIDEAGGWQHDTLTEDMDLSYRMQLAGWKTEYVPDLEVPAEIPEDMNAFKNQQFRWAKGSIQTAKKIIPRLVEAKVSPFRFIQAVFHLTHYSVHPLMLVMAFLSMPILALVKISLPTPIFAGVLFAMLMATGGPSTMYLVSQHFLNNRKRKALIMIPAMMMTGTGLAVNNARAVYEALSGKVSPFHRTPKKGNTAKGSYRPLKDITPIVELFLGLYCLFAFYMFFGYTNFLVTPFLALYASAFIFTGTISIIHFKMPDLIDRTIFGSKQ